MTGRDDEDRVRRTCSTCDRAWDGHAVYCGACGAMLEEALAATRRTQDVSGRPRRFWQRSVLLGVAVLAVAVAGAMVPRIGVERAEPIAGNIGIPDEEELGPARPPRRPLPTPEITCAAGGIEFDCVAWQQVLGVAGWPERSGMPDWPTAAGEMLIVPYLDRIEGHDVASGERRWRLGRDESEGMDLQPATALGDVAVMADHRSTALIDLASGAVRWRVDTTGMVWSDHGRGDLVFTGPGPDDGSHGLVARDPADGSVRWSFPTGSPGAGVNHVGDDLVIVYFENELVEPETTLLDASTGEVLWTVPGWLDVWGVLDDVLVTVTWDTVDQPGDNPWLPETVTLTALDLADGSQRWHRTFAGDEYPTAFGHGPRLLVSGADRLRALDSSTGDTVWEVATEGHEHVPGRRGDDGWSWSTQLHNGDDPVLTLGDGGQVRARAPDTGRLLWSRPRPTGTTETGFTGWWDAVVHRGSVFLVGESGSLVLDLATGAERVRIDVRQASIVRVAPLVLFMHGSGRAMARVDIPEPSREPPLAEEP